MHRSEFHFARTHVNTNDEVTLRRIETLTQSEIWNRFEFTSGLVSACSSLSRWKI